MREPGLVLYRVACFDRPPFVEFQTRSAIHGLWRANVESLAVDIVGMEVVDHRRQAREMYYVRWWLSEARGMTYLSSTRLFDFDFGSGGPGHDVADIWGIDPKAARRFKADASELWTNSEVVQKSVMNVYGARGLKASLVERSLEQYREDVRWLMDERGVGILYLLFGGTLL